MEKSLVGWKDLLEEVGSTKRYKELKKSNRPSSFRCAILSTCFGFLGCFSIQGFCFKLPLIGQGENNLQETWKPNLRTCFKMFSSSVEDIAKLR